MVRVSVRVGSGFKVRVNIRVIIVPMGPTD